MSTPEISILSLDEADESAADMAMLLAQVSSRGATLTADRLRSALDTPSTAVLVARIDGTIVGWHSC